MSGPSPPAAPTPEAAEPSSRRSLRSWWLSSGFGPHTLDNTGSVGWSPCSLVHVVRFARMRLMAAALALLCSTLPQLGIILLQRERTSPGCGRRSLSLPSVSVRPPLLAWPLSRLQALTLLCVRNETKPLPSSSRSLLRLRPTPSRRPPSLRAWPRT